MLDDNKLSEQFNLRWTELDIAALNELASQQKPKIKPCQLVRWLVYTHGLDEVKKQIAERQDT